MNNLWHFSITNNDDTSNLDEATEILDVVMAYHSRANKFFLGLGIMVKDLPLKDLLILENR